MPRTGRRTRKYPSPTATAKAPAFEGSVPELLARLEARIAHHRQEEALHAEQATFHQSERERHGAELARLTQHFESLREASAVALEEGEGVASLNAPAPRELDFGSPRRPKMTKMVAEALERLEAGQTFTASSMAAYLNKTFAPWLKRTVTNRHTSSVLRRLGIEGRIQVEKPGTSHNETVYRI